MPWSKVSPVRPQYFVAPEVLFVEDRKTYPKDNGNTVVAFIKTDTRDLCEKVLDPRKVNITTLIHSGCIIPPGDFMNLMNISDMSDIEAIQSDQNDVLFNYIKDNFDSIKSRLVNVESK